MRWLATAAVVCSAVLCLPDVALACGGCFSAVTPTPPSPERAQVVTDHRMVLSLAARQTTLWDQIRYAGSPEDFVWVLPIADAFGVRVGVGDNAFIDALDQFSAPVVRANAQSCTGQAPGSAPTMGSGGSREYTGGSGGCGGGFSYVESPATDSGSGDSGGGGTTGMRTAQQSTMLGRMGEAVVGPYAVNTLQGDGTSPALGDWLAAHGYVVPQETREAIGYYESRHFDFVVVRLRPGAGVQQMQPLRVTSAGYAPALPLRMIAAGAGDDVGLTLLVLASSRTEAQGFANVEIDARQVVFDWRTGRSNYAELFAGALARSSAAAWVTESAQNIYVAMMAYAASPGSRAGYDIMFDSNGVGQVAPAGGMSGGGDPDGGLDASMPMDMMDPGDGGGPIGVGMDGGLDDAATMPPPGSTTPRMLDRTIAFDPLGGYGILTRLRTSLRASDLSRDLTLQASSYGPLPNGIVAERSINVPPCSTTSPGVSFPPSSSGTSTAIGCGTPTTSSTVDAGTSSSPPPAPPARGCGCTAVRANERTPMRRVLGDFLPIALAVAAPWVRLARRRRARARRG